MRKHRYPGGVKVASFPDMSEDSRVRFPACDRSLVRFPCHDSVSIDLCCIYLVFTMLFIFVKRMYSLAW